MNAADVTHVFTGIAVRDYEAARGWYERLLGRPPDAVPTEGEALWHLTSTASIYVVADPRRAGAALVTLAVDDLDRKLAELVERGITGETGATAAALRFAVLTDPDGNTLKFFEDPGDRAAEPGDSRR